jgi:ABC-type Fe3+-hydroxamate transport system substrate-binding protein
MLLVRGSQSMPVEQILNLPGWSNVPAIRNRRIYYLDDRIELPCPVVFDALEELAKKLHP